MVRVTTLGSLPGTDVEAALRLVFDEPDDLPTLPELPARGPWADMIGRATALLTGLATEYAHGEWRLTQHPGADLRRARATLGDDLDRAEEVAAGYAGPLKVTVCGPWTLAATVFRPLGGRILADRAARTDLAQSLAEGVADHLAAVGARFPAADLVLQVDEPGLPAVLAGQVPTEGGFFRHRAVSAAEAAEHLALLAGLTPRSVAHSCAADVPIGLLTRDAGFQAVSLDGTLPVDLDAVAAAVEGAADVYWGVAPAHEEPDVDRFVTRALTALRPLELGPALADRLWLTPTCGLASAPVARIRPLRAALRQAAVLVDERLR